MISLPNDVIIRYVAASGALSWDGKGYPWDRVLERAGRLDTKRFLPVTPSLTLPPRDGNLSWLAPWRCVRPILEEGEVVGFVNAKGLTNPGLPAFLERHYPRRDRDIIISVYADNLRDLRTVAVMLDVYEFAAVELNLSCPNAGESFYADEHNVLAAVQVFRKHCRHPLIAKVSVTQDVEHLAFVLNPYVQAFAVNSVPWRVVFPHTPSPLARLGGGAVSGKIAQPWTWDAVKRLVAVGSRPVIGPSVWCYEDIPRLRQLGAQAVSFGSVFLRYPHRVTKWLERDYLAS